jgi:hypothetical protein
MSAEGWKAHWPEPRDPAWGDISSETEEPLAECARLDAELTASRWRELAETEAIRRARRRQIVVGLTFTVLAIAIFTGVILR